MPQDTYVTIAGHRLLTEALALLEPERSILRRGFVGSGVQAVHETMAQAYARLDRGIASSIEASGLAPACARGCSFCCRGVKVNVSIPEALAIAERVAIDAELADSVRTAGERRRMLSTDDLFQSGDLCPFLGVLGECRIYDVRPFACRRHCCLDASECEQAIKHPKLKLPVQQHAPANAVGVISALALAAALEDAGLDYRTFELATVVNVALEDKAAEKWLSGERLFDRAQRPVDSVDRATTEADMHATPCTDKGQCP